MNKKFIIYILIFIIGIISVLAGFFNSILFSTVLSKDVIILNFTWLIIIGIIFATIGIVLIIINIPKYLKKYAKLPVFELFLIFILIAASAGYCGWFYGHYQKTLLISSERIERIDEQLTMWDQMNRNNPFYSKKIIIRDDDIGDFLYYPSLSWISNLTLEKNIKITLSIIPVTLSNNSETVEYLNQLDRQFFEFATHGYEHIKFQGLPFDQQYSFIENGTKIILKSLNYTPYTFVPPKGNGDINTTKALRLLGYHSITDMLGYPSYVVNFISDLAFDSLYELPIKHITFNDLQTSFDDFFNSSDEYYVIFLHDWTFIDKNGNLDQINTSILEQSIDYIKEKNVQFFTIEDAYQWYIDESRIRTGKIGNNKYFIDLDACFYNHTIKFTRPLNWSNDFQIKDLTNQEETNYNQDSIEFNAIKGHLYEITII
jgi:peptidoglycan/xylan/chitin deacetylase (PgdA/CDA1 family)